MSAEGTDAHRYAVILAGGRGVRFWPRSRAARPKQLLDPLGGGTLLRHTANRLRGIFPAERIWVLTSEHLREAVARELPEVGPERIIAEPARRNTAPSIGLAAALLQREDPHALMGVFPADHHVENERAYTRLLERALTAASSEDLIVLGVKPRWPETGYGYIEFPDGTRPGQTDPSQVVSFREKPSLENARRFVSDRRFYWNSGQFFWKASVFAEEMAEYLPETWKVVAGIVASAPGQFRTRLEETYGACQDVSVDSGILERSSRVSGLAAPDLGWSDLGSWSALHSLLPKDSDGNCARTSGTFVDATGNYVDVPGKHVAMLGVDDLIVVETTDALLVCRRDGSQAVGDIVDVLRAAGRDDLL